MQVFPSAGSLVRLAGAVCCDQNDAWACERNFIDRRSLEPGYEHGLLPTEPGGEARVLRLVEEAFDRKRERRRIWARLRRPGNGPYTTF